MVKRFAAVLLAGLISVFALARISHQASTAAVDPGTSAALRSVGFLNVLSSAPVESSRRAPCSHARLHSLATKPGEKYGPARKQDPIQAKEISPEEIIKAFTAKESQFYEAWNQYYYKQIARVKVLSDDGVPSNESMTLVFEVVFLDDGTRDIKLVQRAGYLRSVLWTPEDQDVITNYQPFALTSRDLPSYELKYQGKEKIDELNTHVFVVNPKQLAPGKLYFQGKIWVDDTDLQIVRTIGKVVPQKDSVQFPEFETLRQLVDKKYWFPVWSHADSVLNYKYPTPRSVRVEETITYEGFKRFTSSVTFKPVKK